VSDKSEQTEKHEKRENPQCDWYVYDDVGGFDDGGMRDGRGACVRRE
jgi:hypothetical protein